MFRNLTEQKWKLLETQLLCVNLPKNSWIVCFNHLTLITSKSIAVELY